MKPRLFRLRAGLVLFASLAFLAPSAPAETKSVPLQVTMLHGGAAITRFPASGTDQSAGEVVFLVLDYSGSMNDKDRTPNGERRSRWRLLCDSLQPTISSLRTGTEVRIAWIGGSREKEDPVIVKSETEKQTLLDCVRKRGSPPNGNKTPLFATLKTVCGEAKDLVDRGYIVSVNVFSDGESSEFRAERKRKELDEQFSGLFADARFKTCLVWINPGDTPGKDPILNDTWRIGYKAPPSLYSTSVQSTPVTVELSDRAAPGALSYGFFVPDDIWGGMVGRPAQLVLSRDGKEVAEVPIQIQDTSSCAIPIPEGGIGGLSLSLRNIPQPEGALISEPQSVDLIVSEPRKLSVSSTRPADGTTLKEGGAVEFAVVANPPDAKCEWSFGDGTAPSSGNKVSHTYARAGDYTAQVVVRKDGFEPAAGIERKIKVKVLHTKASLEPFEAPVVGRKTVFRCKGEGPVTGFTWYVDGESVAGKDSSDMHSSELEWTFHDSGNHSVQARADMSYVSAEETERKTFKVGEAPFVRIDAPVSGSSMTVGDEARLSAHAEGGVAAVEWKIGGPEPKSFESPVVGASAPANWTPGKPGEYTIQAFDKANKAEPSGEVKITVRPRDVALRIVGIPDEKTFQTGDEITLAAETKGVSKVVWSIVDEDKGKTEELGDSATGLDGKASKAWKPRPEDGDGRRLIVVKDAAGAAEPASKVVYLATAADLLVESPKDGTEVPFGTSVDLVATATGAATDVRWLVNGEVKGTGGSVSFTPQREKGVRAPKKLFVVQAVARKPSDAEDNPSIRPPARTIVAVCPPLAPRIDLSKKDWDVDAPVALKVVSQTGRIGKVEWTFGDGSSGTQSGDTHSHAYRKAGSYKVSARAFCADCDLPFDVPPVAVEIVCPDPKPVIALPRTNGVARASFGLGEQVDMSLEGPGVVNGFVEAGSVEWDFGDGSPKERGVSVHHAYTSYAENLRVRASAVCSRCGKRYEAPEQFVTIERQLPSASFEIAGKAKTYPVKGNITLKDTSGGDVAECVWTMNGKEFARCGHHGSVTTSLPIRPGTVTFGMTAIGMAPVDGGDRPPESRADERAVRVRFGWWAVLLFLFMGGLLYWLCWNLFGRNEPRTWHLYCWEGSEPRLSGGQYKSELAYDDRGCPTDVKPHWSIVAKKAKITLGELLGKDMTAGDDPNWPLDRLQQEFAVSAEKDGDPVVTVVGAPNFENQSSSVRGAYMGTNPDFAKGYFLFQDTTGELRPEHRCVRVYVDHDVPPGKLFPILLFLSAVAVLALVFWACMSFAI